jgi:hypothetical protein
MREDPILITGVYRTGTTYLSRIIDAHPQLNVTYDSVNYFRFVLKKNISPSSYREIVQGICDRLMERHQIMLDSQRIISLIEKDPYINHQVIYSAVMDGFFNFSGKRWGEKTLLEWTNIPTFLSMFSCGKAIHLIRDPRDVLASYKYMTIEPGYRYLDSIFANMHSMNAAKRYTDSLPRNRYLVLIYEEFIEDTKKSLHRICDFLEIDYCQEMLNENKHTDFSGNRFDIKTHTSFPEDLAEGKEIPVGKWKQKLDDFEVAFVESMLKLQMQEFGYSLSHGHDSLQLGRFLDIIFEEPLLKERLIKYLQTGDGVESYPSDPTDPSSWGDTGIKGQGAAVAYAKPRRVSAPNS